MPASTPQADQLRADLSTLVNSAFRDLEREWGRFKTPEAARDALIELLPDLIFMYGPAASTAAADWYDETRAQLAVKGRFRATVPAYPADAGGAALARWGLAPVFTDTPDWAAALTLVQGGLSRRVQNFARDTITASAVEDPHALGWQRVGRGECPFCAMLIARGSVYTHRSADFASHDHCHCAAMPAWDGQPMPVKPYTPTGRNISPADRARVRAYIRTH